MKRLVAVFVLILLPVPLLAVEFSGQVVGVIDGDTIEVLHNRHPTHVRLFGIDCPEKRQAFGQRAKQATSALVFDKDVRLHTHGNDKYGRTVAEVLLSDGTNVNQRLVQDGWCWWYEKHAPKDLALQQSQQEAKQAKRGLWTDPNPVPPWLYRRLRSGAYP